MNLIVLGKRMFLGHDMHIQRIRMRWTIIISFWKNNIYIEIWFVVVFMRRVLVYKSKIIHRLSWSWDFLMNFNTKICFQLWINIGLGNRMLATSSIFKESLCCEHGSGVGKKICRLRRKLADSNSGSGEKRCRLRKNLCRLRLRKKLA